TGSVGARAEARLRHVPRIARFGGPRPRAYPDRGGRPARTGADPLGHRPDPAGRRGRRTDAWPPQSENRRGAASARGPGLRWGTRLNGGDDDRSAARGTGRAVSGGAGLLGPALLFPAGGGASDLGGHGA